MISVSEAQNRILAQITRPTWPEFVPLGAARSRVLAEDLRASVDVPPSDNSAVDGYAVDGDDVPAAGSRELDVVGDLPAGSVFTGGLAPGQALRIMTGAPMPRGADTVYPQEAVERLDGRIRIGPIEMGANVRMRGEDIRAASVVIPRGTVLRPQELGLIASLGECRALVYRRPCAVLFSTGDEVVEPGAPRRPGQIYDANRFTLGAAIAEAGAEVGDLGIVPDERDQLRSRLLEASRRGDLVVTSGGVSVGVYDFVKEVLAEIGVIDFWQVAMQPGRPLAFGRIGAAHFFGLPGNPVASMLAYMLFVRPAILKLAGRAQLFPETREARATEPMAKRKGRREFKRGVVQWRNGAWEVRTTGPQGSGILTSMSTGNCLIVLEEGRGDVAAGETVLIEPF